MELPLLGSAMQQRIRWSNRPFLLVEKGNHREKRFSKVARKPRVDSNLISTTFFKGETKFYLTTVYADD
jgi:hypothetical protein